MMKLSLGILKLMRKSYLHDFGIYANSVSCTDLVVHIPSTSHTTPTIVPLVSTSPAISQTHNRSLRS
jgi:hypothetical protein